MEDRDSVVTPRPPAPFFKKINPTSDPIPSSSPAFATPAYPIASRPAREAVRPPPAFTKNTTPAVLPILLPPAILRPLAFRTITKKHNLTITSSSLQTLASFIGKHCGNGWREEGLGERVLDEVAKAWKRGSGGVILDDSPDKKLVNVLKQLEICMVGGRLDVGRLSRSNSGLDPGLASSRPTLSSREDSQMSLGLSGLDVEDDIDANNAEEEISSKQDARPYMKVINAFTQPRLSYSTTKKSLEIISTPPSLFPPPSHKTALFRNRYNIVHQRLLRNEAFQTPSFSTTAQSGRSLQRSESSLLTVQQAYKITPVANLLGRTGSSHLLLGLLAIAPTTGELALTDLSGSIALDLSSTRPEPENGAWFCPGMMVLVAGEYDEDGSNTGGGVGGMIGGRFIGSTISGPPVERRGVTLGVSGVSNEEESSSILSAGAGFGWVDFLGVGSERAQGKTMRRLEQRILGRRRVTNSQDTEDQEPVRRTKMAILGECQLDSPATLEAIHKILSLYETPETPSDMPLSIVMMGNFVSKACMAGAESGSGSIEYKEHFDALASILTEFPVLLSRTTLIFVPGDNDPWASSWSAGAATALPRDKVPDLFTSRIRRAVNSANLEAGKANGTGEVVWTSNPARISLFGPVQEIVLFRDDVTGRLRRHAVSFHKQEDDEDDEMMTELTNQQRPDTNTINDDHDDDLIEIDAEMTSTLHTAAAKMPQKLATSYSTTSIRKLVKTLLDQSHLSPFPLSVRPQHWDFALSPLSLHPLPTALALSDAECPPFALTFEGCHVMNAGRIVEEHLQQGAGEGKRRGGGGTARWLEYDVLNRKGEVREVRF